MSSSLFKFLFLTYSIALELEYSVKHDRGNAYELGIVRMGIAPHVHPCSSSFICFTRIEVMRGRG